ncbi:hypothetical protein VPH35_082973 [Triticum aestivum]
MTESGGALPASLNRSTTCDDGGVASQKADPAGRGATLVLSKRKLPAVRKRKGMNQKETPQSLREPGKESIELKESSGVCDVMLEFDQFVQYHEMKKKTEEFVSSQDKIVSQGTLSSSQEEDQRTQIEKK